MPDRFAAKEPAGGDGITQFARALSELNIDIIYAHSPQAKGRVERAHQTLQNRLVKELRLRGISSIQAGNAYLPTFAADYDARFARSPANPHDAHRPLESEHDLDEILRWKEQRKLTSNRTLHYRRTLYLVQDSDAARRAAGKMVDVHEHEDGSVVIRQPCPRCVESGRRRAAKAFSVNSRRALAHREGFDCPTRLLARVQIRYQGPHPESHAQLAKRAVLWRLGLRSA